MGQIRYDHYSREEVVEELKAHPRMSKYLLRHLWSLNRLADLLSLGWEVPGDLEAFLHEADIEPKRQLLWMYYLKAGRHRWVD